MEFRYRSKEGEIKGRRDKRLLRAFKGGIDS